MTGVNNCGCKVPNHLWNELDFEKKKIAPRQIVSLGFPRQSQLIAYSTLSSKTLHSFIDINRLTFYRDETKTSFLSRINFSYFVQHRSFDRRSLISFFSARCSKEGFIVWICFHIRSSGKIPYSDAIFLSLAILFFRCPFSSLTMIKGALVMKLLKWSRSTRRGNPHIIGWSFPLSFIEFWEQVWEHSEPRLGKWGFYGN